MQRIAAALDQLLGRLDGIRDVQRAFAEAKEYSLAQVATLVRRSVEIEQEADYMESGVRSFYKEIHRCTLKGAEFSWQKLFWIEEGDIVFSNIMAWEQAIAVAKHQDHRCVGNHRMLTCCPDQRLVRPGYLAYFFRTQCGFAEIVKASPGTAARNKTLNPRLLESIRIPVPPLDVQEWLENVQARWATVQEALLDAEKGAEGFLPSLLHHLFEPGEHVAGRAREQEASPKAGGARGRGAKRSDIGVA